MGMIEGRRRKARHWISAKRQLKLEWKAFLLSRKLDINWEPEKVLLPVFLGALKNKTMSYFNTGLGMVLQGDRLVQ